MKHNYLFATILLALALTSNLSAETLPDGYYAGAEGKTDAELKTALSNIIKGGDRYKYGSRGVNEVHTHWYLWDAFVLTDRRADGTIFDMYSSLVHYFPTDSLGAVSANGVDLEHGFAKSWWGAANSSSDKSNPAYVDLHHLMPAESKANSAGKSNYCPGIVDSTVVYDNGVFRGGWMKGHPNNRVWEPADEYKGDFARAYFYVVTAYEDYHWIDTVARNKDNSVSYGNTKGSYFCLTNDSYLEFQPWMQQLLLQWHRQDPVSRKEISRHDVVSNIQHNRNPFIDYPELVEYIWGNKQGEKFHVADLVNTASDEYIVPADTVNIEALMPADITENSFVARWADAGADYYDLDVYTERQTAKADTVFAMPWMSVKLLSSTEHISWDGTSSVASGAAAVNMGVKSSKKYFTVTLSDLYIADNTRLVVRANVKTGDQADMEVEADGESVGIAELDWNERYYSFDLPEGTAEVKIHYGKKQEVFTLGQIFIIRGEDEFERTSLTGYPIDVNETSYQVTVDEPTGEKIYYKVQPAGRVWSNVVGLNLLKGSAVANLKYHAWHLTQSGALVAVENVSGIVIAELYDIAGRLVSTCHSARPVFCLPAHGVYIVRVGNQSEKLVY